MTYGAQPPAAYFGGGNDSDRLEQTTDHTPDPQWAVDASGNVTGLAAPDGGSAFLGPMTNGAWMKVLSLFRMRMTGTGTVTIDAKNALGTITLAVATYSLSGATNQIEYPYPGDDAVMIRATLTGTATAEII